MAIWKVSDASCSLTRRTFVGALAATTATLQIGQTELAVQAETAETNSDAADFPKIDWQNDWPWWRGPMRNGHTVDGTALPTQFGEQQRVLWKAPVPGRGHASPIIVGDAVYLSTADDQQQSQSIVAYERTTGKQLWKREINRGGFPEKNHPKNTAASPTLACDGTRVISSSFHHKGVHLTALDLNGKPLWQQRVGDFDPRRYEYGYAPSPVLYRQSVIVAAEHDGDSYIVALKREDGKEIWRTPRPRSISFSSPSIGRVAGRDQLLISGQEQVSSYDPATGKSLWQVPGTTFATCGTMVWTDEIVLASGGYPKAETIAVSAGSPPRVLWKNGQQCYEQSMIVFRSQEDQPTDYLVALTDKGIIYCWRIEDGKEMWRERLRGPVSASPILAGGSIYWANELGTIYVFEANPKQFKLIAENRIGSESMASPAVSHNQLFLRVADGSNEQRREYLYCFG